MSYLKTKRVSLWTTFLVTVLACLSCTGCASVNYHHPTYGTVKYKRFWAQEIGSLSIVVDGDRVDVLMGDQKASAPEAKEILDAISGAVKGVL